MAQSTWIGMRGAALVAGCTGLLLSARLVMPAHAARQVSNHQVSNSRVCDLAAADTDRVMPASAVSGRRRCVTVSVPAIGVIRVDDRGRAVAAMTNSGCPPRPGDEMWLIHPDGSMQPAPAERFAHHRWVGDFSEPGVYVAQGRSRSSDLEIDDG